MIYPVYQPLFSTDHSSFTKHALYLKAMTIEPPYLQVLTDNQLFALVIRIPDAVKDSYSRSNQSALPPTPRCSIQPDAAGNNHL